MEPDSVATGRVPARLSPVTSSPGSTALEDLQLLFRLVLICILIAMNLLSRHFRLTKAPMHTETTNSSSNITRRRT
jgi:hypothetical protein